MDIELDMALFRILFFWALIIAGFAYGFAFAGILAGFAAAVIVYLAEAFIVWLFDLDGLRRYRFSPVKQRGPRESIWKRIDVWTVGRKASDRADMRRSRATEQAHDE